VKVASVERSCGFQQQKRAAMSCRTDVWLDDENSTNLGRACVLDRTYSPSNCFGPGTVLEVSDSPLIVRSPSPFQVDYSTLITRLNIARVSVLVPPSIFAIFTVIDSHLVGGFMTWPSWRPSVIASCMLLSQPRASTGGDVIIEIWFSYRWSMIPRTIG
jgi:hypothetical protein